MNSLIGLDYSSLKTNEGQIHWNKFLEIGLPTKKDESWKYIETTKFFSNHFKQGEQKACDLFLNKNFLSHRESHPSLEADAFFHLAKSSDDDTSIVIENSGVFNLSTLYIPGTEQNQYFPTIKRIIVKKGVCAQFKDFYQYPSKQEQLSLFNVLIKLEIEEGAVVDYWQLADIGKNSFLYLNLQANLKKNASFKIHQTNLDNELCKINLYVDLIETGASAEINGLTCTKDEDICDITTYVRHLCADTNSIQHIKGILANNSKTIFRGGIRIEKNAQRVQSKQMNRNLQLDKKTHMISIPQLEIFADDVKAAHGSTTGQINEDEVFYFKSRGIKESRAKMMLGHAFANEIILKIPHKEWQKECSDLFYDRFEKHTIHKEDGNE